MSTPSYFGRAWKLKVTPQATGEEWTVSSSTWDTEALRCTFSIEQVAMQSYWFADIAIYNFLPAAQVLIQKGDLVTLEAGYQSPGVGPIFNGKVFQPIWERVGETDYRLTLHCFVGLFEDESGYVSLPLGSSKATISQAEGVRQVAAAASIQIEYIDPILEQKVLPRGKPFAGRARLFFDQVARDNQMNCWISWKGLNIRSLAPEGETPDVVYAPPQASTSQVATTSGGTTKYTLIGTPQQTELGVQFRTLLDSDVRLGSLVKIDQAILNKLPLYPGQNPILLAKDGLFVVGGIRYEGDTRGNEWYSEITGVTRDFAKLTGVVAR